MDVKDKQNAFLILLEPVLDDLSRFTRAMVRNREEAKDIVSETLLRAYESFDKIQKHSSFKSYLFTIASRINKTRVWRRRLFMEMNPDTHENLGVCYNDGEKNMEAELLYDAMNKLPADQREAIALFEITGLSLEEVRKIQGGTLSGVKSRLRRGRANLANLLREERQEKKIRHKINNEDFIEEKIYSVVEK